MHFRSMDVILLHSGHQHDLQNVENKNTDTIKMCLEPSTV